ncbi:hypothetical protein AAFC00_000901 [Neodothiora populina]|uniref:Peroxin/Ferlin domain-containing protein n=1 Tax=Neodothiora populina TaxID=2781224 RepID=A0ABR3PM95_9PEZI
MSAAVSVPAATQAGPSKATRDLDEIPPPPSRATTATGRTISLVDHTASVSADGVHEVEEEADDTLSPANSLNRRWTKQSLHQSLAHRKYAKYQEDKLFIPQSRTSETGTYASSTGDQSYVKWGKKKVKGLLKTKRQFQIARKEEAVIDILWENQRGWWAFGVPHFSSKSLLNFDPKAWLNEHRKPSPVNITNAQVPDPNWEWAWESWYVDMSRDVDEEGWEYSFSFNRGFSWHGNHPWGHSWVRRRRWLRKRVRKQHRGDPGRGRLGDAHNMNTDYFTIHPSNNLSRTNSLVPSTLLKKAQSRMEEEYNEEPTEIKDIGTLMAHLRRAALDREKIVLVRYFIENAGEDVYYLEEQMPKIMALCVFQDSRRQLLSMLMEKCDKASRHREDHAERGEVEGPLEKRRIDNLMRAIAAAGDQVKKLEYWSDQRELVHEGKAGKAPDGGEGWGSEWHGLDQSGPGGNARSTAKEKGKSRQAVVDEDSREQISPPDSDSDSDSEPGGFSEKSKGGEHPHGQHGEEASSSAERGTERNKSDSSKPTQSGSKEESSSDPTYVTAEETTEDDGEGSDPETKLSKQKTGSSHEKW